MKTKLSSVVGVLVLCSLGLHAGGEFDSGVVQKPTAKPVIQHHNTTTTARYYSKKHTKMTMLKNLYVGAAVGMSRNETYFFGPDNSIIFSYRIGYDFTKYFGVEFRGLFGVSDLNDIGVDYSYGAYLKPQYPLQDHHSSIYGLLGYGKTKISYADEPKYNNISDNETIQNGFSFGIGYAYRVDKKYSVFIDMMQHINKSTTRTEGTYKAKVQSINIGGLYHF